MLEGHKQPPQNVKEVGIHVGCLREDIGDVKAPPERHTHTSLGLAVRKPKTAPTPAPYGGMLCLLHPRSSPSGMI